MKPKDGTVNRAQGDAPSAVGVTVGAFENRIRRQLKEQEERDSESQKRASERHGLMMQGMTMARKAFQETARINLGNRFALDLDINDQDGWPKLELLLIDSVAPESLKYALAVSAHDRQETGTIQVTMLTGEVLAKVQIANPRELERLPLLLKKSIRHFLDLVAAYVLNPMSMEELEAAKPVESEFIQPEAEDDGISDKLKGENVFIEDDMAKHMRHDNNVISESDAPQLDPISLTGNSD